jgi:hypothetical protein
MAAVLLAATLAAGCGGGGDKSSEKAATESKPKPAASAEEFASRFEDLTRIELEVTDNTFGTELDAPQDDDHLDYRLSGYSYYWTGDDSDRDVLLEGKAGPGGTVFERINRDAWSISKAYGPRLVVSYVGADRRDVNPEWERLDRLSEAAYSGDLDALEPQERPCSRVGVNPLKSGAEPCSVAGIPVTSVDGKETLVTPMIEAQATGMSTTDTYVVVAYKVRNTSDRPIRFIRTALRIGDTVYPEAAGATFHLPQSGTMPLAPGAEYEAEVAFDVPGDVAPRAAREGALIMPADGDELGLNIDFAQGWIRLGTVPDSLPDIAPPPNPNQPPAPEGPPDIPVERGSGPPVGGTVRRLYTANSFFPVPENFVPGGVRVGTRAGSCMVPRVDARTRARLLATVRADTKPKDGVVPGLPDRQILLADCGGDGRWAMVSWIGKRASKGPVIFVDEFEWRGGAWHGSPKGRYPGCGIPEAAAAAWQIDISHCARRGEPPGEQS